MAKEQGYLVAVIGAGPAGLYAARELASKGAKVVIFNRDIKPGGLAEYGIYYDKYKMKEGLRKQFRRILAMPGIVYLGNVTVGKDLTLDDLRDLGFQAILVTTGAQGTKRLGIPGEDLEGVYHAKEIVYHYNHLPPYSQREYAIGRKVAIIGVGNVMADIATWLVKDKQVDEVYAVARRGPFEVKFDKKEFARFAKNLDIEDFEREIERIKDRLAPGQDPEEAKRFILSMLEKAKETGSPTVFRFRFLSSPKAILGDENGRVKGLELADTRLVLREDGRTKPVPTGTSYVLDVDTVIFSIGDRVDPNFGLPLQWNAYATNPEPRFPVDGVSYEVYDPEKKQPIEGVFVAGWARNPSEGLVGVARKDGERAARAVLQYLETVGPTEFDLDALVETIKAKVGHPVVTQAEVQKLEEIERAEAEKRGLPEFKFDSNEEMLKVLGLL
ncbi:MAG: FAD-dependent oxidoreductase [Chloroflexi bacterium]|nr:FAD-dependent oxidoreductase [Chloroflexota bacterium]